MSISEKQLGQQQASTAATSIYSPDTTTVIGVVKTIIACAATSGTHTFNVHYDVDGTTYDDTTVLFKNVTVKNNDTVQITTWLPLNTTTGNLAVSASTQNAITFTVTGAEITE